MDIPPAHTGQERDFEEDFAPAEAVAAVKLGLNRLMVTLKNFSLYPETNKIRQSSMAELQQWFIGYLAEYGQLGLDVGMDKITFHGETVFQDKPGEQQSFISPLFRDGIQRLEFEEGLAGDELRDFLLLLNRYRILKEEAEDDLVTALWEAEFPNIKYKSANTFSESKEGADLSALKVAASSPRAADGTGKTESRFKAKPVADLFSQFTRIREEKAGPGEGGPGGGSAAEGSASQEDIRKQLDFWHISPTDEERIKSMVEAEEARDNVRDCLELSLIVLRQTPIQDDVEAFSEFLAEVVRTGLSLGYFNDLRIFLETLNSLAAQDPGLGRFIEALKRHIGTSNALTGLSSLGRQPQQRPDQTAWIDLQTFILNLPPESVGGLLPLLNEARDQAVLNFLLQVTAVQTLRLGSDSTALFEKLPPAVLCELLKTMESLAGRPGWSFPLQFFLSFTRHFPSPVRAAALSAILKNNPDNIRFVSHLLKDTDIALNSLICDYLAQNPSRLGEKALLDLLQENYTQKAGQPDARMEERLINCYLALGRCGSRAALPFFSDVLLKKSWKSLVGLELEDNCHRRGAAMALKLMSAQPEVADILQKALKSPFRQVRQSCEQAEAELAALNRWDGRGGQ